MNSGAAQNTVCNILRKGGLYKHIAKMRGADLLMKQKLVFVIKAGKACQ